MRPSEHWGRDVSGVPLLHSPVEGDRTCRLRHVSTWQSCASFPGGAPYPSGVGQSPKGCFGTAIEDKDAVRGFAETSHGAKSWRRERRVAARIEATRRGLRPLLSGASYRRTASREGGPRHLPYWGPSAFVRCGGTTT